MAWGAHCFGSIDYDEMTTASEFSSVHRVSRWTSAIAVVSLLVSNASFARAQPLADPMRPSDFVDPSSAAPQQPGAAGSGLQVIKISKGRRSAVIDGHVVRVGDKVGDATVVSLSESAAVMKDAEGNRVTLRLLPQGEKTPAAKPPRKATKGKP